MIANTYRSSVLTSKQTDLISVLFEIECNLKELNENFIFAEIDHETILFDLNSTFQLDNIQQNEQIWIIKLTAINDGQTITQKYIDDTRRQFEDLSISIIFGKLICDMSQWNQSQIYFQSLLNDPHDEDLAWIEHSIGKALHWKGEWNEARKYYDRSYDRMMQIEPIRIKDSAIVLSDIGEILYLQGRYEESLDFHECALTIRKKYYPSNHTHIATSLENIGLVRYRQRKHEEAFTCFKQALAIQEEYYNGIHIDIAMSLNNIGRVFRLRRDYNQSLTYFQQAMSIYKKYYPLGHLFTATTMNYITYILYGQR